MSCYSCRDILLEALKALGQDSKLFGLQCLRSGGATAGVISVSDPVSDRLLKLSGSWKSDQYAKDMLKRICWQEYQSHLAQVFNHQASTRVTSLQGFVIVLCIIMVFLQTNSNVTVNTHGARIQEKSLHRLLVSYQPNLTVYDLLRCASSYNGLENDLHVCKNSEFK